MPSIVQDAPGFDDRDAISFARDIFRLTCTSKKLPSERDQNFRMTAEDGREYVLKIANASEEPDVLELQNKVMNHVRNTADKFGLDASGCPEVIVTPGGDEITTVTGEDGRKHFVRLLTYLPGKPFALVKPHDEALMKSLGGFFGDLDRMLEDFDHPAAHREFHWDLAHAEKVVSELKKHIEDDKKRALIEKFLGIYRDTVLPVLPKLRTGVIHGDGNDYNVLVLPEGRWGNRVSGAIDFGDMVHSQVVNDPAIACAYAMLGKNDPLSTAAAIVSGYHEQYPLTEDELQAFYGLACMRLCMSVCHSAHQFSLAPDNEYLRISEKPAWNALEKLDAVHPRYAHYGLRNACGLPPVPGSEKIARWLKDNTENFASIVDADLSSERIPVIDLAVDTPLIGAHKSGFDPLRLDPAINEIIAETGAGLGLYDEARFFYQSDDFAVPTDRMPENRTVHLGLDVHMKAGSPVYAFMKGSVVSVADNAAAFDYGPTVILEHQTDDGDRFFTLHGHLSPETLEMVSAGQDVEKGQMIARIGDSDRNGGWPPHLHFQIICDMLDEDGTFPGVAAPSRRRVWAGISPDPGFAARLPEGRGRSERSDHDKLLERRTSRLGRNLSISYSKPLKIVRGVGQYLITDDGQAYVDGVNNVCHVGHCHPKVVEAGQKQMAVLNTNTRYLHDNIVEYAERLLATFPDPLNVCFFVCSGSEANELAIRLARAYTNRHHLITLDGAYHGNTQGLIDISPYKHDGPGGKGNPPWVQVAEMPCGYRGPHKGFGPEVGAKYGLMVKDKIETIRAKGAEPAAFIAESILGCGGQVVLPDNYLNEAFGHVRDAGGVCICDEVQVGFGRVGTHYWAFETQNAVPDIVTLGKPIGNGHPMAAVVTTSEIADAFNNGMEYFNTFGGNPVSCAIGMAVLDVIEEENLKENALKAGQRLLDGFLEFEKKYPLVGHARGLGLFVGAELVRDPETLEPAGEEASYICNRLKEYGFLMSTDGPLHNVLKLKPPIVFTEKNADDLIAALDIILQDDRLQL